MKRTVAVLLTLLLVFQLCAFTVPVSLATDVPQSTPAITNNLGKQSYSTWSTVVRSYLYDSGESLIRVEAIGSNVAIETYTYEGEFVSGNQIPIELPLFGGFYCGTDSNFLVFGQNNPSESNDTEVIRVVRYDKAWNRLSSASLYGANTYIPFDAGSLRMEQYNGMLYVHTCHEMYTSSDGYHHQANVTFSVRLSDMVITDQYTRVMNSSYGYVSHSFNQFIHVDGQTLLTVCHGDAYPRSIVLLKYRNPAGKDTYTGSATPIDVLPITGEIGQNYTGVSVGGFEITESGYMITGNSVDQDNFSTAKQRNIFLTVTQRENFSKAGTSVIWLTNHAEGANITVSTPQLVKVSDNLLAVLWTENGKLKYAFVNGAGNMVGNVYSDDTAKLSDCQPILRGGKIIWYFTSNTVPQFCTLDPKHPENISIMHSHSYSNPEITTVPTENATGAATSKCSICGEPYFFTLPVLSSESYDYVVTEATCTKDGHSDWIWKNTTYGKVAITAATIPAIPHNYSLVSHVDPTYDSSGSAQFTCSVCRQGIRYYLPPLNNFYYSFETLKTPTCTEDGQGRYVWDSGILPLYFNETIPALGHDLVNNKAKAPTCTEVGWDAYQSCKRCSYSTYKEKSVLGHDYIDHDSKASTCSEAGWDAYRTCSRCSYTTFKENAVLDHDYINHDSKAPTCTEVGWDAYRTCKNCKYTTYVEKSALGHAWDKGTVTVPATSTTAGEKVFTCTRCGDVSKIVLPPVSEDKPCDGGSECPSFRFRDVNAADWFHKAVDFAVSNELFNGMTNDTFEPNTAMSRAMLVTVLWRYSGAPLDGTNNFSDVKASAWYANAVSWASSKGIVNGIESSRFDPDGKVTREQLAAILFRYCNTAGIPSDKRGDLSSFPDNAKVSSWAKNAYAWAVGEGLIGGNKINGQTMLDPQGNATRAQVATILMRFIRNLNAD